MWGVSYITDLSAFPDMRWMCSKKKETDWQTKAKNSHLIKRLENWREIICHEEEILLINLQELFGFVVYEIKEAYHKVAHETYAAANLYLEKP